jgi:hypothetical protein
MYLLSALLLGVTAKGIYNYIPHHVKERLYIKALDIIIAARESCKRCKHPSVEVTSLHFGNRVLTSYVYTNASSIVYPKYSIISDEMVPFHEIEGLCEEVDTHTMEAGGVTKDFGMVVLIVNETKAVQIQQLFNALAGPRKNFRYNSDILIEEALCFLRHDDFKASKDEFYLVLYTKDGREWKVTDLSTKLTALLNPSDCETAVEVGR